MTARMRINDELTLFEGGEVELEQTDLLLFDGQLSDVSESDSDLSESDSAMSESPDSPPGSNVAPLPNFRVDLLGDWTGVRNAANGYRLATDEDLSGPPIDSEELESNSVDWKGLAVNSKLVIKKFCRYLEQHWPTRQFNPELAGAFCTAFVDPIGFYHILFKSEFKRCQDYLLNSIHGEKVSHIIYSYWNPTHNIMT